MKKLFLLLALLASTVHASNPVGSSYQVIRVPSTGGQAKPGSIDLSQSAAVGSSVLATANGGTGLAVLLDGPSDTLNLGVSAVISTNTLVISLKNKAGSDASASSPVRVGFRSATATVGTYQTTSFIVASSITLDTTDSIGVPNAVAAPLFVYAIQDGTSELCISNTLFDESVLQTASALTGGADTTPGVLWCPSAHTSRPIRLLRKITAIFSNPNWGSLSEVAIPGQASSLPRSIVTVEGGNGYGAVNNKVRRWTAIRQNTGADIFYDDDGNFGGLFYIKTPGVYCIQYQDYRSGGGNEGYGIVVNGSAATTTVTSISYAQGKRAWVGSYGMDTSPASVSWCGVLSASDIVWAQTGGVADCTNTSCMMTVTKVSN